MLSCLYTIYDMVMSWFRSIARHTKLDVGNITNIDLRVMRFGTLIALHGKMEGLRHLGLGVIYTMIERRNQVSIP